MTTSHQRVYRNNQDELTKLLRNALWAVSRKGSVEEKADALRDYLRSQGSHAKLLLLEIWQNPPQAERSHHGQSARQSSSARSASV